MSFNERQLCAFAHLWGTGEYIGNVALFIAGWNDYRNRWPLRTRLWSRSGSCYYKIRQSEVLERPKFDQKPVTQVGQERNRQRQEDFLGLLDHLTVGETEQAGNILYCQPILIQSGIGQIQRLCHLQKRFPQAAVRIDDDPAARSRELGNVV